MNSILVPNASVCNPSESKKINIQVQPSISVSDYVGTFDLPAQNPSDYGYGTPFYVSWPFYTGIQHSIPWVIINSGEYPQEFDEDVFHGLIRINFTDFVWHEDIATLPPSYNPSIDNKEYDLYTAILHEICHTIGFASSFSNPPITNGLGSRDGLGSYFAFDQYITVDYQNGNSPLPLIENGGPQNGFSKSPEWFFNSLVDGNVSGSNDLQNSCPGSGPNVEFVGGIGVHPIHTETVIYKSFSHLDGECFQSGGSEIPYVMHYTLDHNIAKRTFLDGELDILRTIGYNIDCDPADYTLFDCTANDLSCAIGVAPDGTSTVDCTTVVPNTTFIVEICPPNSGTISIPIQELLFNDPNAQDIAFIEPIFSPFLGSGQLTNNGTTYEFTTSQIGSFLFHYTTDACNGAVANTGIFTIKTQFCPTFEPECEPLEFSCNDLNDLSEYCLDLNSCNSNSCNLVCNDGEICGVACGCDFGTSTWGGATLVQDIPGTVIDIEGWLRASGSPSIVGDWPDYPQYEGNFFLVGVNNSQGISRLDGIYTFIPLEENSNYLYSFSAVKGPTFVSGFFIDLNAFLIQGDNLIPGDQVGGADILPDINGPSQLVFNSTPSSFGQIERRFGGCFSPDNPALNALWIQTALLEETLSLTTLHGFEVIEDKFSAGPDQVLSVCGQSTTIGGVDFCMLSDIKVRYEWFEVQTDDDGNETLIPLASYDVENGIASNFNGSINQSTLKVPIALNSTTTFRLKRSIVDFTTPPFLNSFTYQFVTDEIFDCIDEDDVLISVTNGAPDPDFSIDEIECGLLNFTSAPSSIGSAHKWFIDGEQFSTQTSPQGVQFQEGTYTILHQVSNNCGVFIEEVEITIDCSFLCECEGSNAINIDAGFGTRVSETALAGVGTYNNSCLSIKGKLIIDEDLQINNGEIVMQAGAEITVENGNRLRLFLVDDNGGVHGCNKMWKGITVESGGELNLVLNDISDAQYAVRAKDEALLTIGFNDFDRNYVGIYTAPNTNIQSINLAAPVIGNDFTCDGTLLPPYTDQLPNPGTKTLAGVYLNDAIFFLGININNPGQTISNDFSGIRNGVIANDSYLWMGYAGITNLEGTPDDPQSTDPLLSNGVGIFLNNSISFIQDCNFNGTDDKAMFSNESYISAEDNEINTFDGIHVLNGNQQLTSLRGNNIVYDRYGIQIQQASSPWQLLIENNILNDSPNPAGGTAFLPTAIHIQGNGLFYNGIKEISGNMITLNERGDGLTISSDGGFNIFSNPISYNVTGTIYPGLGINLVNADQNILYDNDIQASSLTSTFVSFFTISSDGNKFCCNSTENGTTGTWFAGTCIDTDFRNTSIGNHGIGLFCNAGTIIGDQEHAGNRWDGNQTTSAKHSGVESEIANSQFFVEDSDLSTPTIEMNPPLWPSTITSQNQWFFPRIGTSAGCELDEVCLSFINQISGDDKNEYLNIVNGELLNTTYGQTAQWESERYLLKKLFQNPKWVNESIFLNTFMSNQSSSDIGIFSQVESTLNSIFDISPLCTGQKMNFVE